MDIKITNRSDYGIEVIGYVYDEDDDTIDLRYPTSKKTTGIFWNSRKRKRSFNRAIPIMIIRHKDGVEEMFQLPIRGRLQCASDGTYNIRVHNKYIKGENKVLLGKWGKDSEILD